MRSRVVLRPRAAQMVRERCTRISQIPDSGGELACALVDRDARVQSRPCKCRSLGTPSYRFFALMTAMPRTASERAHSGERIEPKVKGDFVANKSSVNLISS